MTNRLTSTAPASQSPETPNTISVEQALAEGVSPSSIRQVAKWNNGNSNKVRGRAARMRLASQATELYATAEKLEAANDNRRTP